MFYVFVLFSINTYTHKHTEQLKNGTQTNELTQEKIKFNLR